MEQLAADELELALASTDAWVARLVCRAFRDGCPRRPAGVLSAGTSPARCRVALQCGLPRYDVCQVAAALGRVDVLEWARREGLQWWGGAACAQAAQEGRVEVLEWAREQLASEQQTVFLCREFGVEFKFEFSGIACAGAAGRGRTRVLQWAVAHGLQLHRNTCTFAAMGGQLATLRWARSIGCPWDASTCAAAARHGVKMLRWARSNGCPWDARTTEAAAASGRLDALEWARAEGCP